MLCDLSRLLTNSERLLLADKKKEIFIFILTFLFFSFVLPKKRNTTSKISCCSMKRCRVSALQHKAFVITPFVATQSCRTCHPLNNSFKMTSYDSTKIFRKCPPDDCFGRLQTSPPPPTRRGTRPMHHLQSNTEEYSLLLFCVCSRARSGARQSPAALAPPLASQGTNAGSRRVVALCKQNRIREAASLFDQHPTPFSASALISACGRRRDLKQALGVYAKFLASGQQPTAVVVGSLVSACRRCGEPGRRFASSTTWTDSASWTVGSASRSGHRHRPRFRRGECEDR